ncbi:hypothetical protein G9F72_020255 [Clostridium estertheticum]|uniref:hypothetical protein n=1 Tax=Clostridium estertheticum TaxID=238834 RepID=UPI001CD13C43|nr:hypothetical protein [Clostridium estertheticum]MBZ9688660.1 hypothetical protein [Clostridium estertheticum]
MKMERELKGIKAQDLLCKKVQYNKEIGFKDILAIIIAQFQILMPIMIGAALVMSLLIFIIMKVWIRS